MRLHSLAILLLLQPASAGVLSDVRAAIARKDLAHAEQIVMAHRARNGMDPEALEALSWLGRGALAAGQPDKAHSYAVETHKLAIEQLKRRPLDSERHLPIALGAAIEVQAHAMAQRGELAEALDLLKQELKIHWNTSIRTRIQKNINLLSLEGKPAPALELREWLGPRPEPVARLKGRPVLLFFWAHWCSDCKAQVPALAKLREEYAGRGLALVGPTQRYGYARRGQEVSPEEELRYIDEVRRVSLPNLQDMPVPVSEENFKSYGASTTPTLVLLDRQGIVRMYHPGHMPYEELALKVEAVLGK
jgi:thiol-disulfide isomerase/thioredoxin